VWKPFLLIFLMILIGTFGFHFIEDMTPLDAFYMTIITIFTVGFREVQPLSPAGQIFTIFVILGGVGTVLFAFTKIAEIVFGGGLQSFLRRKRMEKRLQNIKDHYIICGHGRTGRTVRERLLEEGVAFVAIDNKDERLECLKDNPDCLFIRGDATQEDVLLRAGIKRAKGLAALLSSDADNLYLSFTAKLLVPSLFILAKATEEAAEKKLLQIGANRIVSPYKFSALKIAQGLLRPTVVDFIDLIIRRKELSLSMEEFIVSKDSPLKDRSLAESGIRQQTNVIVVANKKRGADIVFNPASDMKIEVGDSLLVLGNTQAIKVFEDSFITRTR